MNESPVISVIMPVYNAAVYLREAIESVLNQTYRDFEFIIINDGSTDNSEEIIQSYNDPRIVYLKNEKNSKLIYTLNRGIDHAKGIYIARMDADDICLPERFATQKKMLEQDDQLSVAGSVIKQVNEKGEPAKDWPLDAQTTSWKAIRRKMPKENCLAHPSVLIRSSVLKEFRYKEYQPNIEDYDLWLRLLNSGHRIEKSPAILLEYRVHSSSISGAILKKSNFFFKHAAMKRKFIANELKAGKMSSFLLIVMVNMGLDIIKGIAKFVKSKIVS